ncbi:MAG: SRPBCC family protein [Solirubrobacterales bacterium]
MTLPRSEGGPTVEWTDAERVSRSVELDAAPTEVWNALVEETLLAEWLADEVEIEAEPGGEIVCRYADGEERRGEVELVEEAERLAWSWRREGGAQPSRVELVLDAVAERTRLTVIETAPLRTAGPLLLAGTWGAPLGRLRNAVRLVLA